MNNHQTLEKLKKMRLYAMAHHHQHHLQGHQHNQWTNDEYLAMLIDHEWEDRQQRKTDRLIRNAAMRQQATLAEVDYHHARNLNKNAFERIASLAFINKKENIIITGPSGVGKSYLSQALGHQACLLDHRVYYQITARLFTRLKLAKVDGSYLKELNKLSKAALLILDDFGLQALDNLAREILLDIIDDRFDQHSTIVCSQIPVSAWYDIIGEGTIADAVLDRLVNTSHRIDLNGESLRKGLLKNQ